MIDLIKNLNLKANDVILLKINEHEEIRKIEKMLSDLSKQLKFRIFGIIIPREVDIEVLSRERKIEIKELLEESLKEG